MTLGMNAVTGQSLDGLAHIRQSVSDILTTPLGSRVMRRDYGSLLPELIDQPLVGATVLKALAAATIALIRWEPRLRITQLNFYTTPEKQLALHIEAENIEDINTIPTALSIPSRLDVTLKNTSRYGDAS